MSLKKLRIAFMGTPDFAAAALRVLCDTGHDVVCIYTQPPRAKGRGQQVQKSPVHLYAEGQGISVRTPQDFKNDADAAAFKALNLDIAVVAAYGMLLPQHILDAPRHGCINIHPSLLPRWRGTSPVQFSIWKGDEETGVSIMKLVRKMDAGPVIAQKQILMPAGATYETLSPQLWDIGCDMLRQVIGDLSDHDVLHAEAQHEEAATYTAMLQKDDGRICWDQSAVEIDRQIRGLTPWPGVWSMIGDMRFKILEAAVTADQSPAPPGTILDAKGSVSCGDKRILRMAKIQPQNAKAMAFAAAVNGQYLKPGDRFL